MTNTENPYSEIGKNRTYSKFLCQEMLVDYMLGSLDPTRKNAVVNALDKNDDLKKQKASLDIAVKYCSDLSELKLSEAFMRTALAPLTVFDALKASFSPKRWPIPLRWGLEALVVSGLVASIALILFWSNIQSMIPVRNETVLVRQQIKKEEFNMELTDKKDIADFQKKMAEISVTEEIIEPPKIEIARAEPIQKEVVKIVKPPPPPAPKPELKPEPPATGANAGAEVIEAPQPKPKPAIKPKGYVYKLTMSLENLEVIGPEITEKIIALGAIKAGEVEIGWRKPNGNYYHFVLEIEKGQDLEDILKSYGEVQTVRDPHNRIMPENQERYILWIEDK